MIRSRIRSLLLILLSCWLPLAAGAQDSAPEPSTYTVDAFRLESGDVLRNMRIEYSTLGEPRRDGEGRIVNAVVWCHGWSGDHSQYRLFKGLVGAGLPLDPERYYLIFPTALGSPGSSSPSVSGLGPEFPKYTMADMIDAQHRLVTEHLGIERLAGVAGASMGGIQTLMWITRYPDFMDWAIPMAAGPAVRGRTAGIFGVMSRIIEADPGYRGGTYTEQPRTGMELAFMGVYLWYFTAEYYQQKFPTNAELMEGLKDIGIGSAKMDANDIVWRNHAMNTFDVRDRLGRVKARTLVLGVRSDELFTPDEDVRPIAAGIPGAKLFLYDSPAGHFGIAVDLPKAANAMAEFLAAGGS